jgi:PAS domain S-box-containing protein
VASQISGVIPTRWTAIRVAGCYGILAAIWIFASGWLLHHYVQEPRLAAELEDIKGWFFVAVTACVLGLALDHYFRAMRNSEARFSKVFHACPAGINMFRLSDGRSVDVNEAYLEIAGFARGEVVGHTAEELNLVVDPEARNFWLKELQGNGIILNRDVRIRRKTGEIREVMASIELLEIQGERLGLLLTSDVTDRRAAERRLKEREEQLRLFIEHSPAAVAMLDRDMRYVVASHRWLSDYRLKDEKIIGRSHYEVFPEIPERWKAIHRRCLGGAVEMCEADPFLRMDGSTDWVRWEIRPWPTEDGSIGGIIIFSEVITERRRTEAVVRESLEEKTALLKEVHHRVKNNLQVMASLLNLQERNVRNPAALMALRDTQSRIRSMALLHEALYRDRNVGRVNCHAYLGHLLAHLMQTVGGEAGRIRLEQSVAPIELDLDEAIPCGLIVNELVSNAIKHAFPGERPGRIAVEMQSGEGGRVVLTVSDDGVGPTPAGAEAEETLGMNLVQGLVRQINGTLEHEGPPGTRVRIVFFTQLSQPEVNL